MLNRRFIKIILAINFGLIQNGRHQSNYFFSLNFTIIMGNLQQSLFHVTIYAKLALQDCFFAIIDLKRMKPNAIFYFANLFDQMISCNDQIKISNFNNIRA
ncbi:hypothetical protein BpHYR1_044871 [Brachionus plicatilis]|uniref:Uncharacterized protein n=1 Tax=Brachionus plicatilis TaxID=10195 RepID=A0A3M7R255_BRAPC|nr:hypothetical protein BpHYR1_044871 [Brachionus plicatilis]